MWWFSRELLVIRGLSVRFICYTWVQLIATCSKAVGQTSFWNIFQQPEICSHCELAPSPVTAWDLCTSGNHVLANYQKKRFSPNLSTNWEVFEDFLFKKKNYVLVPCFFLGNNQNKLNWGMFRKNTWSQIFKSVIH